jgi:hypothetical protein
MSKSSRVFCGVGANGNGDEVDCDLDRLEKSNAPQLFRRSVYFIVTGALLYFASWSPILCRVTRGISKFPDRMPTPVWIATLGVFVFYDLFIIAQCGVIASRVRAIFAAQVTTSRAGSDTDMLSTFVANSNQARDYWYSMLILCASVPDWKTLAALAAGVAVDLSASVLYSIPSIRSWFGMNADQQSAEPWATTSFLFLVWIVVILVGGRLERRERDDTGGCCGDCNCGGGLLVTLYVSFSAGIFFLWGRFVMSNLTGVAPLGFIVVTAVLGVGILLAMWKQGSDRLACPPRKGGVADRDDDGAESVKMLEGMHENAKRFHIGLVAFTLAVGAANGDRDWYTEYFGMAKPSFFFTTDWESLESERALRDASGGDGTVGIGYCASDKALPLFLVAICCTWSLLSALQHELSRRRLANLADHDGNRMMSVRNINILVAAVLATPAFYLNGLTVGSLCVFVGMIAPAIVIVHVVYGGVWDLFDPPDTSTDTVADRYSRALDEVSAYKWIEYSLSASLMHIVVCYIGGVVSSHELVLCVCLLSGSLLTTNMANAALSRAERSETTSRGFVRNKSKISIRTRVDNELPFLFLSFFAKGVLCVALTVPWIFIDKRDVELRPVYCGGQ